MLSTLCFSFLLQTLTTDCIAISSGPVISSTVTLAMAQQTGRRGGRTQQEPTDVQDAMPEGSSPLINPPEVRVIHLKYSMADNIAQLINSAMRDTLAYPNTRLNTVVYMGPPGLAQKVVDMVAKIDVLAPASSSQPNIVIVPLKYRRADDLLRQIHTTFSSKDLRIAADEGSSSLILSGSQKEITDATAAIETLDQESPSVQLEFAILSATAKKPDDKTRESLPMPEDLQRVAEEAARFGHIEFQGRLTATATQEQSFKISGGIQNRADVGIQGRIVSIPTDGPIKVDFESQMRFLQFVDKPGPSFMLSTTVTAKRGEFVVIGSAPAGFDPGDALILVLHVRK